MAVAEGDSFGKWIVLSAAGSRGTHPMWLCRCSCGTERPVSQNDLVRGQSKSCGCSRGRMRYWTDETISKHILVISAELGRMPSCSEAKSFEGDSGLANAIMKSGGFRGWANRLGLSLKECGTHRGGRWEQHETEFLLLNGFEAERQTVNSKFDILVSGSRRVDVKSAAWSDYGSVRGYVFGGLKRGRDCDFFDLVCVDDDDIKHRFIIPSVSAAVTMLTITERSLGGYGKYSEFEDRLDLLRV